MYPTVMGLSHSRGKLRVKECGLRDTDTLTAQNTSDEPSKKHGERQWSDITLKLAGSSYMLGDVMMFLAGVARATPDILSKKQTWLDVAKGEAGGGLAWFLGGVGAAYYGNPNAEKQLEIQAHRLEYYLKQKGVTIPQDAREQAKLLRKKSFWGHLDEFFCEHPSEILNSMYALGSGMLLYKSFTKDLTQAGGKSLFPKQFNLKALDKVSTNFWIGGIVLIGTLIGLFVKEDPEAKKKAEKGNAFDKAIAFVREKPLRVSAGFYTLNNVFLGLQAWQDTSQRASHFGSQKFKPHYFSTVQLAVYLFGNAMLMMSNRDQVSKRGFKPEEIAQLEDAAAHIIAAQPQEVQQAMLADVSKHMATQKGITIDAPTLASHMATRIAELTNHRLQETATAMKWTERAASASTPTDRGIG
jgi:hypothetical protein